MCTNLIRIVHLSPVAYHLLVKELSDLTVVQYLRGYHKVFHTKSKWEIADYIKVIFAN